MESIKGTTAHLRRTFQYPEDDTTNSNTPEAMDEEEQENLIQTLADENTTVNTHFRHLLLALPLLSTLPYLLALLRFPLASLLSLTSLAATAYLTYAFPPTTTGIPPLDRWASGPPPSPAPPAPHTRRTTPFAWQHRSPLEGHLPLLNGALALAVFLLGLVARGGVPVDVGAGLGNALPLLVYAAVLAAKAVMAGVDPERELGGLRYEYKGA